MVDNKLSMHPGKTELTLFVSKTKLKKVKNFQVKFENYVTHATTSVQYLGLNIDNHLSGDDIVQSLILESDSCTDRPSIWTKLLRKPWFQP